MSGGTNKGRFDWSQSFLVDFDPVTGLSKSAVTTKRRLSHMACMFSDVDAAQALVQKSDPVIYEFYEMGAPEASGDLAFGLSITYPGKVGEEYYMTKGHFHSILDTAEVYYVLQGSGLMLLENPEGDVILEKLSPGHALYVPRRYAHRTINTGNSPLMSFFTFRADAGHDYGTIEIKGYRKLVIEKDGKPQMVDNPRWA